MTDGKAKVMARLPEATDRKAKVMARLSEATDRRGKVTDRLLEALLSAMKELKRRDFVF
ncbi:hypothetical protein [Lysinibacillus sp. NPDC096259]|uniref:hypothetical protein n=1 Tax=Lysinibacillus sp. NPDC096259 TaxID=3390583 RepID=UPI003CFE9D61